MRFLTLRQDGKPFPLPVKNRKFLHNSHTSHTKSRASRQASKPAVHSILTHRAMSDEIILLRHKDTLFFHYNVFFIKKSHFYACATATKKTVPPGS